jgi:hypothetical protein
LAGPTRRSVPAGLTACTKTATFFSAQAAKKGANSGAPGALPLMLLPISIAPEAQLVHDVIEFRQRQVEVLERHGAHADQASAGQRRPSRAMLLVQVAQQLGRRVPASIQ